MADRARTRRAYQVEPNRTPRPERRLTPDEMRRMIQALQVGEGPLRKPLPPPIQPHSNAEDTEDDRPDPTDRAHAWKVARQLGARYAPDFPGVELIITPSTNGVYWIEVQTATVEDARRFDAMTGGWYAGLRVVACVLETTAPKRKRRPRIENVPQQQRRPLHNQRWRKKG